MLFLAPQIFLHKNYSYFPELWSAFRACELFLLEYIASTLLKNNLRVWIVHLFCIFDYGFAGLIIAAVHHLESFV